MTANPFRALGLDANPDLTIDQVRAAWRAIAAATHPDRADGGDPDAYAAASLAYAALRTRWGRTEAYADLLAAAVPAAPPRAARAPSPAIPALRSLLLLPARIRHGRPAILTARILTAITLSLLTIRAGAGTAPAAGVITGIVCWLALTTRGDLAPPPGR